MSSKFKLRLFTVFSICVLCIAVTIRSLQNDTFYIIKLGEYIYHHGIDLVDHYSWVADLSYTYPHWLYDLLLYIVYNNFGLIGVYISTIIFYIILIFSIYFINLKLNKNELMATIVSFITLAALIGFATARSQIVTIILFLWEVYFVEMLIRQGKKRYIIYLSIISLLVANLHATIWPFYFILFLPYVGHFIIRFLLDKTKNNNSLFFNKLEIGQIGNIKLLIFAMVLGLLMGAFSPSRICFTYVFKVMQGSSQQYIVEHAPLVLINNISFLIYLGVMMLFLTFTTTKIKLNELFMLVGIIFMCFVSFRHTAFFYVIGFLFLSVWFNRYLIENNDRTLDVLTSLLTRNKIIFCSLFIIVIVFSIDRYNENKEYEFISNEVYPVDAVQYIKNNLEYENMHLYNDYNFGAYLLFYDIPVFIDSRCDLYLKEFNGLDYSIFDDAMNIEKDYEKKFEKYDVSHVLIKNDSYFYRIISKDENYKIIYNDDFFTLFEVTEFES